MKALWIGLNFAGLGLVIYAAFNNMNGYLVSTGFACIGISYLLRFLIFRKKKPAERPIE